MIFFSYWLTREREREEKNKPICLKIDMKINYLKIKCLAFNILVEMNKWALLINEEEE